ncbi:hypothetical protein JL720_9890 [Aureococcus anophagefferens]|nr:hypothetical protein JL720_9890 [Aureococcus anophagefferens]
MEYAAIPDEEAGPSGVDAAPTKRRLGVAGLLVAAAACVGLPAARSAASAALYAAFDGAPPDDGGSVTLAPTTKAENAAKAAACADCDCFRNVCAVSGGATVTAAHWASLDGFVVTRGLADGPGLDGFGGGFYAVERTSMRVHNTMFVDNRAVSGGAAFGWIWSSSVFYNCHFVNNTAVGTPYFGGGGGVALNTDGANATYDTCVFSNNYASRRGGALFADYGSWVSVKDCTFEHNRAYLGGALFADNRAARIGSTGHVVSGSTFRGNAARLYGGASLDYNQATSTFATCTFIKNNASAGGGLASISGTTDSALSDAFESGVFEGNAPGDILELEAGGHAERQALRRRRGQRDGAAGAHAPLARARRRARKRLAPRRRGGGRAQRVPCSRATSAAACALHVVGANDSASTAVVRDGRASGSDDDTYDDDDVAAVADDPAPNAQPATPSLDFGGDAEGTDDQMAVELSGDANDACGGGLLNYYASPWVENVLFASNAAARAAPGGIYLGTYGAVHGGANNLPRIHDSVVAGNDALWNGEKDLFLFALDDAFIISAQIGEEAFTLAPVSMPDGFGPVTDDEAAVPPMETIDPPRNASSDDDAKATHAARPTRRA